MINKINKISAITIIYVPARYVYHTNRHIFRTKTFLYPSKPNSALHYARGEHMHGFYINI